MSITKQDYFGALCVGAAPIICISLGMWFHDYFIPWLSSFM
jgi:hypothetical protein